ncbi:MAG: hypothetical protein HZB77_00160 [Chloroflexi bacterium]|nr:hypothetical protein [Chloroflexota bacterium]
MAEIRCSMCSKMNPDTRDECQFCGARLKPLTLPPTSMLDLPDWNKPAAEKTAPAPPAADDDDWLRRLQGDAASTPSTSSVDAASDWLAQLNAQDESSSQPAAQPDADNWLARLQADSSAPASSPEEEPQTAQTEDASDWLARLNAQDESSPTLPPPDSEPVGHSGKTDQWLSRLGASDNVDLSVPAASEQDGAADDWLSQIHAEPETPPPPVPVTEEPKIDSGLLRRARTGPLPPFKTPEPPTPPPSTSTLPSWLAPSSESDSEIPDWIKGSTTDEPSALTPSADSALPDWLTESSIPTTAPATTPDDSLDWLATSKTDAPKDSALPDWMSTPTVQSVEQDSILLNKSSAPDASKDSELPEWMTPSAQTVEQDSILLNKPESATPESLPDWLSSSAPSQAPPLTPATSTSSPASSTNELEWLSSLSSESPAASIEGMSDWLLAAPADVPPTDSLDWMSSLNSPTAPPPSTSSESDSLDWLSGAPPDVSSNAAIQGAADWLGSFDSKPKTSPLKSDIGGVDEPDWLKGIAPQPASPTTPSSPAITLGPEDRNLVEGLPSWLDALRPSGLESFPSAVSPPAAASGAAILPDFSELSSLPVEPRAQPIVKDLSGASLPSWLKSMKPVDEHAPQADMGMDHEESAGPLAGMRGTLLAESVMTMAGKPGESVERLIVTDAQTKHAEIFARIIQEETEVVVPRVRKKEQFTYAVDRLLIAVVMMALVILPSLASFNVVKPPELFSKPGLDFYNYVDKQLSSKQIALVALDYEVGYSNELNPAVKAVVFHLIKRNVRVAMVSSSPMGAVMAQEILIQAVREVESERGVKDTRFAEEYGKKYIHLGYIPGGVIGLQNFVLNPQETVTSDFVQGKSLWTDQTLLSDLKSGVGDFGLIVVAASSAETAQGWIEQVGTPTKAKMVAISSASSTPLIYPYYSNKQLIGLLTRLPDVIVYSRTVNRKLAMSDFSQAWPNYLAEANSARVNDVWQGYALSSNGIAAILAIGALVSVVMLIVIRRREQEEAAKAVVTAPRPKVAATEKPVIKRTNGKSPATKKAAAKVGKRKVVRKKK